jgi:hypothetical protein
MPLAGGDLCIVQSKLGLVGALEGVPNRVLDPVLDRVLDRVLDPVLDRAHASLPAAVGCLRLLLAA